MGKHLYLYKVEKVHGRCQNKKRSRCSHHWQNSHIFPKPGYKTKHTTNRLQAFINIYLRRIQNIWWGDKVSNEEMWKRTGQVLTDLNGKVELNWTHPQKTCHKHHTTSPEMEPPRKRSPGRNVWERAKLGRSQNNCQQLSEVDWRKFFRGIEEQRA